MPNWFASLAVNDLESDIDIEFVYIPDATERMARDSRGWFASAQVEIGQAMETLAIRLQKAQVAALERAIEAGGREQRGTHYLEDAILSPSNRVVTGDGFLVGVESAFEESEAGSYWRGLEEGTSKHIGQKMYGLWVTAGGGLDIPREGGRNAIGFLGWRKIDEDTRAEHRDDEKGGRLPGFRIHKKTEAVHYLQQGVDDFVASGAIQEELNAAIAKARRVQEISIERGITTVEARGLL
jgi:hypothetical protein